ncbi:MAG: DUF4388 domain-containing protein [Anaeromyxobacter sp.]
MPILLDIDPHGRVVPQSEEAKKALADRAGRFTLLPAAPDLLVARRTPAGGGTAGRPRCALAGDLAAFPIADLIGFLHQARLTGLLTVASGGAERGLAFREGELRSARSTAAGERLGDVAVRLGYATEAQLAKAHAAGSPIGKSLVDLGFMTANDLFKCLHEQVTSVFQAILQARAGTFHLMDEDVPERGAPLTVNTQSLLMDGIRRIDEMSLFKARIPPDARLRRRDPKRAISLHAAENKLLALADGRTPAEIARAAHMNELDATKILYHLAEAGYLEPAAAAPPVDPAVRLRRVVGELSEALREVVATQPDAARPGLLAALRSFLADGSSPHAPVLGRLPLANDATLDAEAVAAHVGALDAAVVASLDSGGDRANLALRALRELVFFALFLVGERLGPGQDEALSTSIRGHLLRAGAQA